MCEQCGGLGWKTLESEYQRFIVIYREDLGQ
jgi:hypothetical protein